MSIAYSKASSPQSAMECVILQLTVITLSLSSSSSCPSRLARLPVTDILSSILHSITFCTKHFLRKMWLVQLSLLSIYGMQDIPRLLDFVRLHFSPDRSNWSSTSLPTFVQNCCKRCAKGKESKWKCVRAWVCVCVCFVTEILDSFTLWSNNISLMKKETNSLQVTGDVEGRCW